MNHMRKLSTAAAALAALCPLAAAGQTPPSLDTFGLLVAEQSRPSFAVVGAGARAAGMGGAFTALADDASAASFNPAGLALLVRPEASLAFDSRSRRDRHGAFTDVEDGVLELYDPSSTSFDSADLNFASATWPIVAGGRNLTFQLSYHRVIDFTFQGDRRFDERLTDGTPIAHLEQEVRQAGDVSTLSVAAAYQVTQRMSLGLTLSRWIGDWRFSTRLREEEIAPGVTDELSYRQENDWRGWNATAGLLLRYRYVNLGATVRSGFSGDYTVDSELTTNFPSRFEPSSHFEGSLRWPASWTLGVALKPRDTWFVTTDYAEFDWDDMNIRGLGEQPINFFDLLPEDETAARHAGQWRFGTEYTLLPGRTVVALRAGYSIEPRPIPRGPNDEKSSIRATSLGIGWKRGPVSVDVAFERSSSTLERLELVDPLTVAQGRVEGQAVGKVDVEEHRIFLSVLYQFESRRAVQRLFHFLFVGPNEPDEAPASGASGG
jgi:long-subunit fatty acid transport protein